MSEPTMPVDLEPGEILLRFYQPSLRSRLTVTLRRGRMWSALGAVAAGILLLPPALLLGWLHPWLGAAGFVLVLGGVGAGFMLPIVVQFVVRPPVQWWVTSRRLVTGEPDDPDVLPLDAIDEIDVTPPWEIELIVDGTPRRLRPVDALPELWGAVLMGRALSPVNFPPVLPDEPEPTVDRAVCWTGEAKDGTSATSGVLVFRPDRVAWVPFASTSLGGRAAQLGATLAGAAVGFKVRQVRPAMPIQPLFHRIRRLEDPAAFDRTIDALTRAWGGFVREEVDGLEITPGRHGDDVSFAIEGVTFRAVGVSDPAWPEVEEALGRARARPPVRAGTAR